MCAKVAAFALAFLAGTLSFGVVQARALELGVNGHPFAQVVYKDIPVQEQLDLVRELGGKWYRVDCYGDMTRPDRIAKLRELVTEAKKRGITVLPVIFPDVDLKQEDDPKTLYKRSYDYAKRLVSEFKNEIPVWELHNEVDHFCIVKKGELSYYGVLWRFDIPSGDKRDHYEPARVEKAMALLKGLSEGVRAAAPGAQRIINGSWKHVGFLEHVRNSGIGFEIIGWHWYSEMGDIADVKGFRVLERLAGFNKRIWITEMNKRGGSRGGSGEAEQAAYLADTLLRFQRQPALYPIETVILYELLDEPQFGPASAESYYGLVRVRKNPNGRWQSAEKKPAFHKWRVVPTPEP